MKATNVDLVKVALALGMAAFQLHIFTMTVSGVQGDYRLQRSPDDKSKDNVIQAFLIIAYFLFIFALIFLLVLSYSNIKGNKGLSAITALTLFFAVASVVIGLAVNDSGGYYNYYTTSTYATGAACGLVGGVVLLVSLCV